MISKTSLPTVEICKKLSLDSACQSRCINENSIVSLSMSVKRCMMLGSMSFGPTRVAFGFKLVKLSPLGLPNHDKPSDAGDVGAGTPESRKNKPRNTWRKNISVAFWSKRLRSLPSDCHMSLIEVSSC